MTGCGFEGFLSQFVNKTRDDSVPPTETDADHWHHDLKGCPLLQSSHWPSCVYLGTGSIVLLSPSVGCAGDVVSSPPKPGCVRWTPTTGHRYSRKLHAKFHFAYMEIQFCKCPLASHFGSRLADWQRSLSFGRDTKAALWQLENLFLMEEEKNKLLG